MKKPELLMLLLLYANVYLSAQETQDEFKHNLDTVIVEAVRSGRSAIEVPFSVDYINAELIGRGESGRSLDELLFTVPGVIVDNRFNPSLGDKINIRGVGSRTSFGVRGIKIMLDNIPLTMPDGQSQLNNIDFSSVGTVEIIRGPSSSLYGNAAGGVINIKTEQAFHSPFSFQPKFLLGAFGLRKYESKFSGVIGGYSYIINLSKLNSDGYREHSSLSTYAANSVLGYEISPKINLKLIFNYYYSPYALNPGSLNKHDAETNPTMARDFVKQQGGGQKTTQWQSGLSLTFLSSPQSRLESSVYFVSRDLLNPIPGRIIDLQRNAAGIRTIYNHSFSIEDVNLNLSLGTDIETQFDDRKEFVNLGLPDEFFNTYDPLNIFDNIRFGDKLLDQAEDVIGAGPFFQSELSISAFTFLLGLRFDSYRFSVDDRFFDDGSDDSGKKIMKKLSPAAGINYRINNLTKLFFNYSTAYQTPTTVELSNRPDGLGGFNPDLLPEEIYSFELGFLRYALFNYLNINASVFYMSMTNMLIPYQVPGSEEIFYDNAGKAENKGFELMIEIFPFRNFSTSISYSGYDFIFKDYVVETDGDQLMQHSGNKVPGIPAHRISAVINYRSAAGLFWTLKFVWEDKYLTNDFNGPPPNTTFPQSDFINGSYFKTDLRLGYLFEFVLTNAEVFLGINNIFNERYNSSIVPNAIAFRYFEPAPERNWYTGIKMFFSAGR